MTFEPPERPAGSEPAMPPPAMPPAAPPPPPPPPAAYSQPTMSPGGTVNPAAVHPMDWGILAAGFLAFIFSFISYYTYSVKLLGVSATGDESAWHGFFGWFAMLLALAGAVILAIQIFLPNTAMPFPVRMTVLGLFAVASLCVILAGLIDVHSLPPGFSSSRGAGYYLSLIVILAGAVLSFLRLRATGGKLPWENRA